MRVFLCVVVIFAWAGCTPPAPETAVDSAAQEQADLQAVKDVTDQWDAAGDCESTLPLVTDDYIRFVVNRPALVGKQAWLELCQEYEEQYELENSKNVNLEVRLAGDWAYVRGTWSATLTPKSGGDPIPASEKWMDIRERQADGSWKISRAAIVPDVPVPLASDEE